MSKKLRELCILQQEGLAQVHRLLHARNLLRNVSKHVHPEGHVLHEPSGVNLFDVMLAVTLITVVFALVML
jgi:hypothetical protein